MRKSAFFILSLNLLALSPAFGDDLSVLDLVRLNDIRLQAADTSVMLYIGWKHDEPEAFKETAKTALAEVDELIRMDESLQPPEDLKELVGSQKRALKKQALLYQGIATMDEEGIKKGYEAMNNNLQVFYHNLDAAVEAARKARNFPLSGDRLKEEMRTCPDSAGAKAYQEGVELIRAKKYGEAREKFGPLLKTYQGTAFGSCVALRLSDSLAFEPPEKPTPANQERTAPEGAATTTVAGSLKAAATPFAKEEVATEKALALLSGIVQKDPYSPVIFEAFLKWRTLTQEEDHGMSNFSDIPNDEYNKVREKELRKVRQYQKTHPQDPFAEDQAESFLIQPNIERGEAYGNSNGSFYGTLYLDPRYYYDPPRKEGPK